MLYIVIVAYYFNINFILEKFWLVENAFSGIFCIFATVFGFTFWKTFPNSKTKKFPKKKTLGEN